MQVLSVEDGSGSEHLKGWKWGMPPSKGTYHALYPRAWTVYEVTAHFIIAELSFLKRLSGDAHYHNGVPAWWWNGAGPFTPMLALIIDEFWSGGPSLVLCAHS